MKRTNINALLKMVRQYLNGEMGLIDFVLDFPYEMEKRYQKAVKEDPEYAICGHDVLLPHRMRNGQSGRHE